MKIYYIPPKQKKKKKDVVLYSLTQSVVASLFCIKDPTILVIVLFNLLLASYYVYLTIKKAKVEKAKAKEEAIIKAWDRKEKLRKIAEANTDKSCKNVNVENLF